MTIQLVETGEDSSFLLVADHVANLLNGDEVRCMLSGAKVAQQRGLPMRRPHAKLYTTCWNAFKEYGLWVCVSVWRPVVTMPAAAPPPQVKTALADTPGSKFLAECSDLLNSDDYVTYVTKIIGHLDQVFATCSDKGRLKVACWYQ